MRDPPDFDTLESTELLQIFQDINGKPIESVTEVKKLQLLSHTHHFQVWTNQPLQIMATLLSQSIPAMRKHPLY